MSQVRILALILLWFLLIPPATATAQETPGVFIYIRDPSAAAPPAEPGAEWTIEVSVYTTADAPLEIAVGTVLDQRLELLRYAAISQAGGRPACVGALDVECTIRAARWKEAYLWLTVRTPEQVDPCGPLLLRASAEAAGLARAEVARERSVAGAERCSVAAPPPPQLSMYGVGGVGTCASATLADTLTADPPGRPEPAAEGVLAACWDAPPAWVEAVGPGGSTRWDAATAPPPPELTPRTWLLVFNEKGPNP